MSLTNTKVDASDFTQPISAVSLPLPTGAATEAKQTQPGVDIGDVTINNATGASAVNIQDGGNVITVDGTVAVTQSTSPWVENITQFGSSNIATGVGASGAGIPRVTVANDSSIKITDGTDTLLVNTDGSISVVPVPIGTHGNAWNAATVSSGNNSAVIDCQYARTITIFGNSSNNLNPMRIQGSQDNTNFFTVVTFAISTGNFGTTIDWGARYLRLQSGQGTNFTVTATVAGK